MNLIGKKIRVGNCSQDIQTKAFELGFRWYGNSEKVSYLTKPYLIFHPGKHISYCNDLIEFEEPDSGEEITLEELLSIPSVWEPKRGERVKTEDGVFIYLSTIEKAEYPHIVVARESEESFRKGEKFLVRVTETISQLPTRVKVTMEEIAAWKGCEVENLDIKIPLNNLTHE